MTTFTGTRYLLLATKSGTIYSSEPDAEGLCEPILFETLNAALEAVPTLADSSEHYIPHGPISCGALNWRERERIRLTNGHRTPLEPDLAGYTLPDHFAHCAKGDPRAIAYTKNESEGVRDVSKRMRVSAYLEKFAPNLSHDDRQRLESNHVKSAATIALKWAVSGNEIVWAYTTYKEDYSGLANSCMRYPATGEHWAGHKHPCFAYGDSDFRLAYLTDDCDGLAIARAIVCEPKKVYSRCYGSSVSTSTLMTLLEQAGYSRSHGYYGSGSGGVDFDGARLKAVVSESKGSKGKLIMPYLDEGSCGQLSEDGEWVRIIGTGRDSPTIPRRVSLRETRGVAACYRYNCDDCGAGMMSREALHQVFTCVTTDEPSEGNTTKLCGHCFRNNSWLSAHDGRRYSGRHVGFTTVGAQHYPTEWAETNLRRCGDCHNFVMPDVELRSARIDVTLQADICPSCVATRGYFWCEDAHGPVADFLKLPTSEAPIRKKIAGKLLVRAISIFAPEAATWAEGFYADLHELAMAEANGDGRTLAMVHRVTGKALLLRRNDVHTFHSVRQITASGVLNEYRPTHYDISLEPVKAQDGDYIQITNPMGIADRKVLRGVCIATKYAEGVTWAVKVLTDDGRITHAEPRHTEVLTAEEPPAELVNMLQRLRQTPSWWTVRKPFVVGEDVFVMSSNSRHFGRVGKVINTVENEDSSDLIVQVELTIGGSLSTHSSRLERRSAPIAAAVAECG